ncbi:hypothetical protein C1H46_022224 [Malus baccata]|uniref:Uncharacterized protein n=1 Tax=Malus baccata TaxID=106549 RepID=A0A540M0J3_MALBA|nr:hypothetical protein C1H46_022224 [Malus baccata]
MEPERWLAGQSDLLLPTSNLSVCEVVDAIVAGGVEWTVSSARVRSPGIYVFCLIFIILFYLDDWNNFSGCIVAVGSRLMGKEGKCGGDLGD